MSSLALIVLSTFTVIGLVSKNYKWIVVGLIFFAVGVLL